MRRAKPKTPSRNLRLPAAPAAPHPKAVPLRPTAPGYRRRCARGGPLDGGARLGATRRPPWSGFSVGLVAVVLLAPAAASAWDPLPVASDPLLRMPGTQPAQDVDIASYASCSSCHAGYDPNIEPGFLWKGSMMAQAARDFMFWPAFTVAAQDSIWAFGNPNAADSCERCHFPRGWLGGRSDPPNASAMAGADFEGVLCEGCHRMFDPFFADSFAGAREGSDWPGYWDEANAAAEPSQAAAQATFAEDTAESALITLFNGSPFFTPEHTPWSPAYTENANGQYFVTESERRRASFADDNAMHATSYSRYHKSKYFCSSCHDVSNSFLLNQSSLGTSPGDGTTVLPSEQQPAHDHFAVERTFSEFMLSDYGLPGGAPGSGPFDPTAFETSQPGNAIASCQDCHMPDRIGRACVGGAGVLRPVASVEHPESGQPLHDLTGGNAFVPFVLASAVPGSPNHDPVNEALLTQGPAVLTLDLAQGSGLDPRALLAGHHRALQQLARAASIQSLAYDPATGAVSFRIQNHTGHKLITGYPEGRRMFASIKLFSGGALIHHVNPYAAAEGTLKGLDPVYSPSSPPLAGTESHVDELVYEAHSTSTLTAEPTTFHFVLATGNFKDNRIPPRGFRIGEAGARLSEPAWLGSPDPGYFTAAEYAGGYDAVALNLPPGGDSVVVELYYQTASREYVEFLRDEINGVGTSLSSPAPSGEETAYIVQEDPFFDRLKPWGDTVWQLWEHNKEVPGAAPVRMTQAMFVAQDLCANPAASDGDPCEDGDACTTNDTCSAGVCVSGAASDCDDGNECTADACDPSLGCTVVLFVGLACEDGNLCTAGDVCAFGVCVSGASTSCADGNPCSIDSCDPAVGCLHDFDPDCSSASSSGSSGAAGGGDAGGASSGGGSSSESATSGDPAANPGSEEGCACGVPGSRRTPPATRVGESRARFASLAGLTALLLIFVRRARVRGGGPRAPHSKSPLRTR